MIHVALVAWRGVLDIPPDPDTFAFLPILLVALLAFIAIAVVILVLRFVRKGG